MKYKAGDKIRYERRDSPWWKGVILEVKEDYYTVNIYDAKGTYKQLWIDGNPHNVFKEGHKYMTLVEAHVVDTKEKLREFINAF